MLRDFKFLRRNSSKKDEIENVPVNPDGEPSFRSCDLSIRPPLNAIQDPAPSPKPEADASVRTRIDKTPSKPKARQADHALPRKTPDKNAMHSKYRFGWSGKNDPSDDFRSEMRAGAPVSLTPGVSRGVGRAYSGCSESVSTQSTPTKSVSKPPPSGFRSRIDGNGGARGPNFSALYKGIPNSSSAAPVVNTVEVPHFDLKEDPSFWLDHNVQVIIRVRPLNSMEKSTQSYNRCLKQESGQSITWVGQQEARFTFDHVACETVDQEMLFRMAVLPMVENCLAGYNSCLFAYGQTGSGKTYTMLGETEELEFRPSPHRGMTPRIFEFLFARIQAEEESRRDEHIKYSCKCSFLEIYNEQITDLLDPSSTNLQLREDVKAGVYVENLSEFEVQTVSDVLKLLAQGSLNRKVAATNMNRESSRSHCVFTCVIESRWEKDSTTNLRFARLNLVDLAGSERQKTSGAEGERLKEAASINRSLSTLGHVIMILVDVANGRLRHVPYRDSKLTFLLQDSLGGNSKTMIIANVSPSICCAAETLNTLKFAQRARLIQNNAVINEDSTGDVIALKRQIQILKEELAALKRQSVSRCLTFGSSSIDSAEEDASDCINYDMSQQHVDKSLSKGIVTVSTKQLESLEAILAGSLRREQMAEMSMKKLDAEIEQLNHLVRQREEETRSTKMMLRFREEKIQRMESLISGSLSAEAYLLGENKMLSEECHLLQSKLDKNPEVTRFALENIRLSDELKRYQEFYEEGEREILKDEISRLQGQLLHFNDGNSDPIGYPTSIQSQDTQSFDKEDRSLQSELERTLAELEECKCKLDICLQENAKLNQDISDLQSTLRVLESRPDDQNLHINSKKDSTLGYNLERIDSTRIMKTDEEIMDLQLELDITKIILQEERSLHAKKEEEGNALSRDLELVKDKLLIMSRQYEHANNELKEAKSVIEVLESQQILLINEIEGLKKSNSHHITVRDQPQAEHCRSEKSTLEVKLLRMNESLEKAKQINRWYQTSHVLQSSNKEEVQKICRQAEAETAEVIVCMQEELATLQQKIQEGQFREIEAKKDAEVLEMKMEELDNRVFLLTEANEALLAKLDEKDSELMKLSEDWELLASEVEGILANGHDELINASSELDFISSSFPERRIWICEQVGRMMKIISEKDVLINELGRYLEDANKKKVKMESKLTSLRSAAFVMNEAQEHAHSENERKILKLKSLLSEKTLTINILKDKLREAEHLIKKTSTCATAAFLVVNNFSENNLKHLSELTSKDVQLNESSNKILRMDALLKDQAALIEEDEKQVCFLTHELEKEKQTCAMLEKRLSEEQQHADTVRRELEDSEMNELLKTQEKLGELRSNLVMLRLCMSTCVEHEQHPKFETKEGDGISFIGSLEGLSSNETNQQDLQFHFLESIKSGKDRPYGDLTHNLLREELEFALNLLKEVKADITKIFNIKEDKCTSRDQSAANMKDLSTLVFALQEAMSGFEKRVEDQVDAINHRLEAFEITIQSARTQYYQTKEYLESEVGDAKVSAAQKAAQASHVLAKFEDAQSVMKEADAMIKGLTIANESLKLDVERLKQAEATLVTERDRLVKQVGNLESTNFLKDVQLERLEEQFGSDLAETRDLVIGLEDCIAQMQADVEGNLLGTMSDCLCIRPAILETSKLISTWLEDIWSAIIGKDSAVSALHLCHMRTLLETVSGMNVENSFLQHGLGQSNTVIASLREQNSKSIRELETCIVLKGKLLVDIKNCFDKILQKEEEAEVLTGKLAVCEKRISDLQAQEEMMLQRSNYMGSELAILMKELDFSNSNFIVSLLEQEEIMKDQLSSHFDKSCIDSWEKEIESLVLGLTLEEKLSLADTVIDKLKEELIVSKAEATIQEQLLVDRGIESTLLLEEIDRTRGELRELQVVNGQLFQDLGRMTAEYESSQSCATAANIENQRLQERVFTLENSHFDKSCVDSWEKETVSLVLGLTLEENLALADTVIDKLQEELIVSKAEATIQEQLLVDRGIESTLLLEEIDRTRGELRELQVVNGQLFQDLGRMTAENESSQSCATAANIENRRLQERVFTLENSHFDKSCIDSWEKETVSLVFGLTLEEKLALADTVIDKLKEELIVLKAEATIQEQLLVDRGIESTLLLEEIDRTRGELRELQVVNGQLFQDLGRMTAEYESSQSCATAANIENRRLQERVFTLENSFSCLQNDLEAKNNESSKLQHFQAELLRKDEVLKGLLFDLSLLQESASNTKDKKDEMAEMITSLEELEEELVSKSNELDEAISYVQKLENELQEKMDIISNLQSDISKERDACKLVMCENHDLRANIEDVVSAKGYYEEELRKSEEMAGNLETERSQLAYALGKMNEMIESLTANLSELAGEKEQLQHEVLNLRQQLEEQKTVARKNEAIAAEAEHMSESKTKYAEDKEAEVRLLEKSIEELECTIQLLESNVEIIKGEAERQRLQREELEQELVALKDQMQNAKRTDSDWKRHLNEKEKELEEALERIQTLEKKMANKDAEIATCKDHISELNLHAEAQASEYKLKFKELQVMVKQVKPETHTINAVNHSSSNSEKNAMKSRGSGSPFKCIGLGLAQQIKSEKDEDLTAARLRIEELESLAVSRQKEIFALNTRLAAAESMTHDVIRDLLGVKLDVTNYASLLNNQQLQQIADKAVVDNIEPHVKEQELLKLKQQLNDFIEERQGWLEEIDRRQAELIAAQIALEKLRQHYQLLKTENEMVKMENVKFKKQVTELEGHVNKLSGQQNLHQRIHHHAKIKEENNILKLQNEELGAKFKRAETMLSRIREELAHYRASIGRGAFINFDEERRLNVKLKEVEGDRVQLAQQLLRLCTSVLKAAGITKPQVSDISPDAAEKALEQIKSNFHSMEREMQNLAHKNKVANERIQLMDLVPQSSSTSQRIEANCRSPRRASPARFLSTFDR